MNIYAMLEAQGELQDMLRALAETRALTDDEMSQLEASIEKVEGLQAQLKKQEDLLAKVAPVATRQTPDNKSTKVQVGEENWKKDPKKGFSTPQEFFRAVVKKSQNQAFKDHRLEYLSAVGSDEQSAGNDAYGGFLVPSAFMAQPLSVDPEVDPTAGRTMEVPMEASRVDIPARVDKNHSSSVTGGLQFYRRGETGSATSSRIEMEQVSLKANSMTALSFTTEELLQDSPATVAALLSNGIAQALPDKLIREKLNGTGVGQFEGVFNSPAAIEVAEETSQTAELVKENLYKMRSRCWGYGKAIWLAGIDLYPFLAPLGGDGNGSGLLFQNSISEDRPEMLLGRPIFFTEHLGNPGTKGDIILVNWSEYLTGSYTPLESAESIHVRFENHERAFKFSVRNDGRCWWRSALTPATSTQTLSPIVTLGTRV